MSICRKLGIGKMKATTVTLQMVDKVVKFLIMILEDVPIKTGHLYIPTKFIIMDIKEDPK